MSSFAPSVQAMLKKTNVYIAILYIGSAYLMLAVV